MKVFTFFVSLGLMAMACTNTAKPDSDYFADWPEGKSPEEIGKKVSENFLTRGHYQVFEFVVYPEVCTWYGAFRLAKETGDHNLAEKLVRRFDPYLGEEGASGYPFQFHVDHCVNGVVPLEIYKLTGDIRYRELGMKRADYQWEDPTEDGITRQARYWVDDIYMISAIQTAAYRETGDMKYLDRAALTTATYLSKLQKDNGLFWHAEDSPFAWGRGVGWYAAGMTEILRDLPEDHQHYDAIMKGYLKTMSALLEHQSESGLWRQLVDKPESWEETSGTGMFAYSMVSGVKRGWLDEETYGPVARRAWLALVDQLDENYELQSVCVGTNKAGKEVGADPEVQQQYYLDRPRVTGDYHGQAPLLWTAAALLENTDKAQQADTREKEAFKKAEAADWQEVFSDSCTGDWTGQWFLDGQVASVSNSELGMQLSAGPQFKNDAHHMVLWTKESFRGDLKIEFDYTRLDFETRCVNILYIQATGSGEGPYEKDIAQWREHRQVPAMRMYFDHTNAYHISFAAFPNRGDERKSYIRARRYMPEKNGLEGSELKPDYYPEGLFAPGVPHRISVIKKERDIYMKVSNAEQDYYCHFSNSELPVIEEGRIGLRLMYTRSSRFSDFKIFEPK